MAKTDEIMMGKTRLIAYIESPYQVLGAFEFQRQHSVDIEWVIRKSETVNDRQIISTLDILEIDRYAVTFMPKIVLGTSIKWIVFIFKSVFSQVLLGDPASKIGRLFLNKIIIDDGTFNIQYIQKNTNKKYWTIFDTNNKNNFDFINLRKKLNSYNLFKSERSFFIGQPLSELGLISEEKYLSVLDACSKDNELVYFPHRRESREKLSKLDVNVHFSEAPLELELLLMGELPISVIGFYSTALYTLKLLYGIDSYCYKLELVSKEVELIYQFFEQNDLKICVV